MAKRSSKKVTLTGWAITSTDKAVKWHDKATGYELWFAISTVTMDRKTITVPDWMYIQKIEQWEREERENERQNKRDDERDERELELTLAQIEGRKPRLKSKSKKKKRSIFDYIVSLVIIAAIVLIYQHYFRHS